MWLLFAVVTQAFVAPPAVMAPATVRYGFFDDLFDKLEGKNQGNDEWKEKMWKEQQEILKRRRATGGFLSADQEKEIAERRAGYAAESTELAKIQKRAGDADVTEEWKKARDAGKFRTSTKGLQRDASSSRLGSAGLFSQRIDERLPYIDRGYVKDKKDKKEDKPADDFFEGLKGIFQPK